LAELKQKTGFGGGKCKIEEVGFDVEESKTVRQQTEREHRGVFAKG